MARDDRERWKAIDDFHHSRSQRSCLLSQKGRRALADRERICMSFWRRYRDYLKNTKATSNVPMLARLALPSTQSAKLLRTRSNWEAEDGAEPSLVNNSSKHFF